MFRSTSSLTRCVVTAALLCAAHRASAGVPYATYSSGNAKTAACQVGNTAGQAPAIGAICFEVKPTSAAIQNPTARPRDRRHKAAAPLANRPAQSDGRRASAREGRANHHGFVW